VLHFFLAGIAKLVIIDGIISLHRAGFAGRGTLADRQQRLNGMLHKIIRLGIAAARRATTPFTR
jgi:hypothetical protein